MCNTVVNRFVGETTLRTVVYSVQGRIRPKKVWADRIQIRDNNIVKILLIPVFNVIKTVSFFTVKRILKYGCFHEFFINVDFVKK